MGFNFCTPWEEFVSYASNPKNWRESYLRVHGAAGCVKAAVKVDGVAKFPLRWTTSPASITGYDYSKMSAYERDLVSYLEKMLPTNIAQLLNKEPDRAGLESYLCEFSF